MSSENTDKGLENTQNPSQTPALTLEEQLEALKAQVENEKAETEKWKGYSRKHETDFKNLRRETTINTVLEANGLPSAAKTFLVGEKDEDIIAKAEALKALLGGKVENPEVAEPVVETPKEEVPQPAVTQPLTPEAPAPVQAPVINPLQGVTTKPVIKTGNPLFDAIQESFFKE